MNEKGLRGKRAEEAAALYLRGAGWEIIERNYRCRWGEIDLIAREGETIVFVEVRSKSNLTFGLPEESIGRRKQEKLRKVARHFLARLGRELPCRFDVIAVAWDAATGEIKSLRHLRNIL
ncbi:YraN family protein [Ammonifex thiophilus]|uniref:UPF0102 protein DXX99_03985 n=1 Tax=Ammonifex thiophilus TaxID=444093 RepID=A0A3D8P5R0_9THEO|nr:YraN family protein [Ammonifex thiophilus]RDV84001.1 YraN family protein [Ammonifex thiophilus]